MDWEYIEKETSHIRIEKFEKDARRLAKRLFHKENSFLDVLPKDEKEGEILTYILGSGTYGTLSNRVQNDISGNVEEGSTQFCAKVKYCIRRLFPGMEYMGIYSPFLCKHKLLIPFFWLYRLAVFPVTHRKKIWAEIKTLMRL